MNLRWFLQDWWDFIKDFFIESKRDSVALLRNKMFYFLVLLLIFIFTLINYTSYIGRTKVILIFVLLVIFLYLYDKKRRGDYRARKRKRFLEKIKTEEV